MAHWIIEEYGCFAEEYNAGSKARKDVSAIAQNNGFQPLYLEVLKDTERKKMGLIKKIVFHFKMIRVWKNGFKQLTDGDVVLIQLPLNRHTVFFKSVLSKLPPKVKIIGVVHDLECLRASIFKDNSLKKRLRYNIEEVSILPCFDKLIVHNDKMRDYIVNEYGIDKDKLVVLGIFDYLIDGYQTADSTYSKSVIIAGNLSEHKSGYIYHLPSNVEFELFGVKYDESRKTENINYHGSFPADDLPFHLEGGFGLVWDGPQADICTGVYGEYLKYNNPHKTSLYLACGIPVIIWSQAALASFVNENNCGIVVDSIYDINKQLEHINQEEYMTLKKNAEAVGMKLRQGDFLRKALLKSLD